MSHRFKNLEHHITWLLQVNYSCEFRCQEAMSGRYAPEGLIGKEKDFSNLLTSCDNADLNPFHVIRVMFGNREIGDSSPAPTKLLDRVLIPDIREYTEAWKGSLRLRLVSEWRAASSQVNEISESLNCSLGEASLVALNSGVVPIVFGMTIAESYNLGQTEDFLHEALRWYCLSPESYAVVAAEAGYPIPTSLKRHGKAIRKRQEKE